MNKKRLFSILASFVLLVTALAPSSRVSYAAERTFPETGKTVSGLFLTYWNNHGGLAQQGYPISEEREEASTDGQTYTVQYFERAVFEKHPENAAPYDVQLSLLGSILYKSKYDDNAPGQTASKNNARTFPETGKTLGGVFRKYWEQHGGLAQQGYPISNEFQEIDKDGEPRTVQYFERAVFELHPENAGKTSEVLLSLLGLFRYEGGSGTPGTPPNAPARLTVPGWTHITVTTNKIALFYNAKTGVAITARLEMNPPNVGALTILQKFPDASKDQGEIGEGWTSIEAGPNNQLLFYASSNGAFMVLKVDDNGEMSGMPPFLSVGGFSSIKIDPVSGMIFYQNKDEKTTTVDRLNADGTFTNIKATGPETGGISDDLVVFGLDRGVWYDYAPDTGVVSFLKMNDKGDFEGFAPPLFVGKGVTQVVSDYHKYGVYYSKSDGVFKTAATINAPGVLPQITGAAKAEKSWSIVAATQTIFMICYDDKGNINVNYVAPENGVIVPIKTYDAGK